MPPVDRYLQDLDALARRALLAPRPLHLVDDECGCWDCVYRANAITNVGPGDLADRLRSAPMEEVMPHVKRWTPPR
jgi:hypothetical protein